MMGYMEQELHVLTMLKIRGASRNLAIMSPTEKNLYLRNYSQYVHRSTDELNVFYSKLSKTDVVLFHALESMLVYFNIKIEQLFVPKFYHENRSKNFLKTLKFMGVWDNIDRKGFSKFPDELGRKLYEYQKNLSNPRTISIPTADNNWPMTDIYYRTIGAAVRGFSFLFPNASKTLKDNFISSNNLLNIAYRTEETANVLTSGDFFPEEKEIKKKLLSILAFQSNNL